MLPYRTNPSPCLRMDGIVGTGMGHRFELFERATVRYSGLLGRRLPAQPLGDHQVPLRTLMKIVMAAGTIRRAQVPVTPAVFQDMWGIWITTMTHRALHPISATQAARAARPATRAVDHRMGGIPLGAAVDMAAVPLTKRTADNVARPLRPRPITSQSSPPPDPWTLAPSAEPFSRCGEAVRARGGEHLLPHGNPNRR